MLTAIRNWVIKTMMKDQTGIVKTLPKRDLIEFNVQMTAERLARNGVNPQDLKNANQVENAINQIENRPPVQEGIKSTSSAKVFDLKGKEIPKGSKIMGGEATETEAEVLARLQKENKKSVKNIKNKMTEIDEAIDNASPGFAGDRKYDAQLVADSLAEKRFNKDFYDLDQKQQMDLYDEAYTGLSKQRFKQRKVDEAIKGEQDKMLKDEDYIPEIIDPEDMAQGGRAGFKTGLGKGFLEFISKQLKPRGKVKFDDKRFREGPIDLDFLENIDKKDLAPFIRTRDTGGLGGYGMYDNFADMPAGLQAAELIKTIKTKDGGINYAAAELFIGKKLKGNESVNELIQMVTRKEMRADGGRIGYAEGTPSFEDYLKERGMIEKRENLERLMREFQEDMRRKKVMQQKQEAKDGGRIGLKTGMTKRAFLKLMGGVGAGIGALKTGLLGFGKGTATKEVAKEVFQKSTTTPPPYFFELAETIKKFGKVTDGPQERLKIHSMPSKDGKSELMLTEDIGTGEMQIKKIGKENDMTTEVQTMDYSPSSALSDESGKVPGQYDEYTEYNSRIIKDEYNDPMIEDGIKVDEIIDEVREAPPIKKAAGGIARMLGE